MGKRDRLWEIVDRVGEHYDKYWWAWWLGALVAITLVLAILCA